MQRGEEMLPNINGRVAWIFEEDNYDIDLIVGVEHIKTTDLEILKTACMKSYDAKFIEEIKAGDVIVGGKNFGYGHPHYPSFKALRAIGIAAVFAESFSPGFYRGETTNGFPLIECPDVINIVSRWDHVTYDWDKGIFKNVENNVEVVCNVPQKTKQLIEHNGIINYLKANRL